MENQIPLAEHPIRSEELLLIQKDINNLQDGLGTVVNENNSRNINLSQASRSFYEFLQQLYQRGEILQNYAKALIEKENELALEQRKYNTYLFNLRVLNADLPAEEEKLSEIKEKLNDISEQRKKKTKKIEKLKLKINSMISEHNKASTKVDKIHLGITDDLYDDMGDTNVNVFIEVQNLRNEIEKVDKSIELTKSRISDDKEKKDVLMSNMDVLKSLKKSLSVIPDLKEKISMVSKQIKEIYVQQNKERVKALQYSTELTHLCSQQDEIYENVETHKSFNSKIPSLSQKVVDSENQINEIKNELTHQIQENKDTRNENIEKEKKIQEELNYLNAKIQKANKKSDLLESKLAEVEILLDNQEREKLKNKSLQDLNNIQSKYKKEKVNNALLNFNISNPIHFLINEEVYQEKKKLFEFYDNINKEITEINYQIGEIHFKIEYELMRQNVLEAENNRMTISQNSADLERKKFDEYYSINKKNKFFNDNENENSVSIFVSNKKSEREKRINMQRLELSKLENVVSIKKSRTELKSQKIMKTKHFYEQSIQNWTKSDDKTEDSFSGLSNDSQEFKKQIQKNELFKLYIKKASESFRSQSQYWEGLDSNNENDETRQNLINWAMQVDQVNKKLMNISKKKPSLIGINSQSYQSSKTEVSTYLEKINSNSFSYSEL